MAAPSRPTLDACLRSWRALNPQGATPAPDAMAAVAAVATLLAVRNGAPACLAESLAASPEPGASTGWSVDDRALVELTVAAANAEVVAPPELFGLVYQARLPSADRRKGGVFYTPATLARGLVRAALEGLDVVPGSVVVLDPAAGGGAFLLAAAAHLRSSAGWSVPQCVAALRGCDVDADAVAVARLAVAWWAWSESGSVCWPSSGALRCADGLARPEAGGPPFGEATVVVGNPPFLNQLQGATARGAADRAVLEERFGAPSRGYVDTATLFLLAALDAVRPGGRVALVQPESMLVAGHGAAARRSMAARAVLDGLWIGGGGVFEAGVRVCAPRLRRRLEGEFDDHALLPKNADSGRRRDVVIAPDGVEDQVAPHFSGSVTLWSGLSVDPSGRFDVDSPEIGDAISRGEWAQVLAVGRGVPAVRLRSLGTLAGLATATAGFRDQYYGLVPFVGEAPDDHGPSATTASSQRWAPLITSGLIGAGVGSGWGVRPARFAAQRWLRPAVDLDALAAGNPKLHRWVSERLRPKLLVAAQTSVLCAALDPAGTLVPSVPVIAVEPIDDEALWLVAAVLWAPLVSVEAARRFAGAGLSAGALRVSARQLLSLPTPSDDAAWRAAAVWLRESVETATNRPPNGGDQAFGLREQLGERMIDAYRIDRTGAEQVKRWWSAATRRHRPAMFL